MTRCFVVQRLNTSCSIKSDVPWSQPVDCSQNGWECLDWNWMVTLHIEITISLAVIWMKGGWRHLTYVAHVLRLRCIAAQTRPIQSRELRPMIRLTSWAIRTVNVNGTDILGKKKYVRKVALNWLNWEFLPSTILSKRLEKQKKGILLFL